MTIPEFRTPSSIAERLFLNEKFVQSSLVQLEQMGLARVEQGVWQSTQKFLHLQTDSPLLIMQHSNWRNRALLDVQKQAAESVHYTSIFSISKHDILRLKKLVLRFIEESRGLISHSPEEELSCLNVDFFEV